MVRLVLGNSLEPEPAVLRCCLVLLLCLGSGPSGCKEHGWQTGSAWRGCTSSGASAS